MGSRKLGIFLLLLLFHLPHLLPAYPHPQNSPPDTDFVKQQNATEGAKPQKFSLKEGVKRAVVSVNRRGGGVGGHAGGGGHGEGGHAGGAHGQGNGKKSPALPGGAVIPLYVAGGASHHNNQHNHGSNHASSNSCSLSHLVLSVFMSLVFVYF